VLDRAASGVEDRLAGEPEVLASVQQAIGESYLSLHAWDRAEAHLRAAATLQERRGDSTGLTRSISSLAIALERQRRAAEALPLAERVLEHERRAHGPRGRAAAMALQNVGAILNRLGRLDEAERAAREGLSILAGLPDPDEARRVELLNSLWSTAQGRGRYAEAESLQRDILAGVRRLYGDSSFRTAIAMSNLATSLYSQRRWTEAESLQRAVLGMREIRLAPDHPDVASSINALAMTLRNLGRFGEAESLLHRVIALRTRLLGAGHRDVLVSRSALASLWKEQGRLARAEAEHRAVLAIRRRTLDPVDPLIASSLAGLGETLALQKRYAEAERCLREALERREGGHPAGHPEIARARERLAKLYDAWGRKDLAATVRSGSGP
jgi:serine/threonine-protein kinase